MDQKHKPNSQRRRLLGPCSNCLSSSNEVNDFCPLCDFPPHPSQQTPAVKNTHKRIKLVQEPNTSPAITSWTTDHAPKSLDELKLSLPQAKIDQVKDALLHSSILFIYGPPGSCKTSCVHLCAQNLGFEICEYDSKDDQSHAGRVGFQTFLNESFYPSLFSTSARRIVLLENLPEGSQVFDSVLARLLKGTNIVRSSTVIVYIHTITSGEGKATMTPSQVGEILSPQAAMHATLIHFNPVAPTRVLKTLKHFTSGALGKPLDLSMATASTFSGDLRNALNTVEFANKPGHVDFTNTSRDDTLDMLHAVGKLLRGPKLDSPRPFPFEAIAHKCCLEPLPLLSFVFENFYKYASLGNADLVGYTTLATMCVDVESLCQSKWSSLERANHGDDDGSVDAVDEFATSVLSRTASCWQRHQGEEEDTQWKMIPITKPANSMKRAREMNTEKLVGLRISGSIASLRQYITEIEPFTRNLCWSSTERMAAGPLVEFTDDEIEND